LFRPTEVTNGTSPFTNSHTFSWTSILSG
jgi:hypothetical protein